MNAAVWVQCILDQVTQYHVGDVIWCPTLVSGEALKQLVGEVMLPQYATSVRVPAVPGWEQERVSALFIAPHDLEYARQKIGGEWRDTGQSFGDLRTFRRVLVDE